jgi:hypothetical protein
MKVVILEDDPILRNHVCKIVRQQGWQCTELESRIGEAFNDSGAPGSTGLGLALIKGICDLYEWDLNYTHSEKRTQFQIKFRNSSNNEEDNE